MAGINNEHSSRLVLGNVHLIQLVESHLKCQKEFRGDVVMIFREIIRTHETLYPKKFDALFYRALIHLFSIDISAI